MHYVVAYQKRGERLVEMIQYIQHPLCAAVAVIRIAHHAYAVNAGQSDLCRSEVPSAQYKGKDSDKVSYRTPIVHKDVSSLSDSNV